LRTSSPTPGRWTCCALVDAILKTASGKILRRVLKEQERQRLGLG
jgi:acyl-CoA synthetase (AMP-forming)/AMP-acid ligase II